jgi:putative lipoic acid-binding regulatory protein
MDAEKIIFPTDYPIKVVARASADLRPRIDAIFVRHFGDFSLDRVTVRDSAQSNFVALTYLMLVQSSAQLGPLHNELQDSEGVVMVL